MQVKGNIIFISSDVPSSLEKILPQEQQLFPVSFKRKLSYEGHYIEEVVEKDKIRIIFDWLRKNNPLYYEVLLKDEVIDEFCQSVRKQADRFEEINSPNLSQPTISDPVDEIMKDKMDEIPLGKQYPSVMVNKYEENVTETSIPNKMSNMIVRYEVENKISDEEYKDEYYLEDEIYESEDEIYESDEDLDTEIKDQSTTPSKKKKMEKVSVAPGEHGSFENWGEDIFLEEKCFPMLFPKGKGGYLNSCLENHNTRGFASYCRDRLRGVDPRFREDPVYLFFLTLVKLRVEIQRSITTNMRQARKTPNINKDYIMKTPAKELERVNKTYSVFKNIRGTGPYYQNMQKNAMATIRQMGSPHLFFTLSYAEFQNDELFKQVLETVLNRNLTKEEIDEMKFTSSEKGKIITENVVETTLHFQKRLEKVLLFLKNKTICRGKSKRKYRVFAYFYRIEFQQRGEKKLLTHCHVNELLTHN